MERIHHLARWIRAAGEVIICQDCAHVDAVCSIIADEVAARMADQDDLAATYEAALAVGVQ